MKELEKMMSKRDDIAERYDTDDSEVFPFVWNRLQEALLEGIEILSEDTAENPEALPLVAHNVCFDSRYLREVFRCYRMDYPEFVFNDTLAASRLHFGETLENHRLPTVAQHAVMI